MPRKRRRTGRRGYIVSELYIQMHADTVDSICSDFSERASRSIHLLLLHLSLSSFTLSQTSREISTCMQPRQLKTGNPRDTDLQEAKGNAKEFLFCVGELKLRDSEGVPWASSFGFLFHFVFFFLLSDSVVARSSYLLNNSSSLVSIPAVVRIEKLHQTSIQKGRSLALSRLHLRIHNTCACETQKRKSEEKRKRKRGYDFEIAGIFIIHLSIYLYRLVQTGVILQCISFSLVV